MQDSKRVQSFRFLMAKCLALTANDELLVVYDESMLPYFAALERALVESDVTAAFVYFPRSLQMLLAQTSHRDDKAELATLPAAVIAAISACTAMLNLIDSYSNNASVRRAINRTPRRSTCRLATIPGINDDILDLILRTDFEGVYQSSEEVAWLLGEASQVELDTSDSSGRSYRLTLRLDGWENEPIMSPGVLLPGSWGNIPPGETFCCPSPATVNGNICINGSVPGHVLGSGEEVVLTFQAGRLVRWESPHQRRTPAMHFFDNLERQAGVTNDKEWNTFAELGFGLNGAIDHLTGNPLFDEKAAGTLHIAVGDNSIFGADVWSLIHEDLVVKSPTMHVNGEILMIDGMFDRQRIDFLRKRKIQPIGVITGPDMLLYLRENTIARHQGELVRRLSKAQRINFVRLAETSVALALGGFCEALETYDRVAVSTFLAGNPSFGGMESEQLLYILHHYGIVRVRSF